jgi:hypothetical protein
MPMLFPMALRIVLPILAELFEAAVEIPDVGDATNDRLAIELEHEAEYAVRRRMLRSNVDEHVLCREIGLDELRLGHCDLISVRDERNALRTAFSIDPAR